MDIINNFFTFLTDKTRRFSHKATMIMSLLAILILVDNILGISYYYNNQNKIEQIQKISELIKNPSLDEKSKDELKQLRKDILHHKSLKDLTCDLISNISFDEDKPKVKHLEKLPKQSESSIPTKQRNYYWHFISSSWFWLILMIGLPIAAIADKKESLGKNLLLLFLLEILLWFFAWLHAKLLSLIPIIWNEPLYNYFINVSISIILIAIVYFKDKKK